MKQILLLYTLINVAGVNPDKDISTIQDLTLLLPDSSASVTVRPITPAECYVGEDLYQLINGGAVIYYEYGFVQVATRAYADTNGNQVSLELYEMRNPAAAFGIFTFKTDIDGEKISIGSDAMFEKYYLNFWKGKYLATLTAHDIDENNRELLVTIARLLESKITNTGQKPALVELFPDEDSLVTNIEYVRGHIGLSNYYNFHADDIFGVKECVIMDYDPYRIFIFRYHDEDEGLTWFENAKHNLINNDNPDPENIYFSKDYDNYHMYCRLFKNYILVYLGTPDFDPKVALQEFIEKIP